MMCISPSPVIKLSDIPGSMTYYMDYPFGYTIVDDKLCNVSVVSKSVAFCAIFAEFYEPVIRLSCITHREKRLLKLKMLLEKLPKVNFETFRLLSKHLHNVAGFRDINKVDNSSRKCLSSCICNAFLKILY